MMPPGLWTWAQTAFFGLLWLLIAVSNIASLLAARRRQGTASQLLFIGGILGAVAVFACPIPGTAAYAWLPAALDPGSGYALGSLVVNLCRQKWGRQ